MGYWFRCDLITFLAHSLETMRLIQHNATAHRSHHAGQHNKQPDASDIRLAARIVLENDLIEQRRDGIENAHIDAVRQQQQNVVGIQ